MSDTLTLKRFLGNGIAGEDERGKGLRGIFVDTETTGLDSKNDKIVELTVLPFRFTPDGSVLGVEEPYSELEDPGIAIPAEATKVHCITDDMVQGKSLDNGVVNRLARESAVVISHNAEFDRPILERRFPVFRETRWGCSYRDVPWKEAGYSSSVLEFLLFKHCGEFVTGQHRSLVDAEMGVRLIGHRFHGILKDETPLAHILEAVRTWWVRCFARNAHYDTRHDLKARGYRWANEGRVWYRDVPRKELEVEADWLRGFCEPVFRDFTGKERYSERI